MSNEVVLTPMMKQYRAAKAEIPPDAVLLFRLGDFYEMFFEDAARVSSVLDIVLTKRGGVPMCGFPYHALDIQLPRLLTSGVKVAIAEQLEDPRLAKGIVKRAVTRIITPGTVVDSTVLQPERNNFLLALLERKDRFALASLDISTAEFRVTEIAGQDKLETELNRLGSRECIVPKSLYEGWEKDGNFPKTNDKLLYTPLDDWIFAFDCSEELLKRHFGVLSLDGFGCRNLPLAVSAAGAVLYYATENLRQNATHITKLSVYNPAQSLELDAISQRNLELVEPMFGTDKSGTLLHVLDRTVTPMGGRLLRSWILRPLYDREAINRRLDAVEALKDDPLTLAELHETLGIVRDLERIIARLNLGNANARDLLALANSVSVLPGVKALLENFATPLLEEVDQAIPVLPELAERIAAAIVEEPPLGLNDGGVFKTGYNAALDEFRQAATEGKNWLSSIQQREQERTTIKSLKVKYNQVFGYYIEISKANLNLVPDDYIRKQTLVNAERFITPELKELESKILGAEDKAKALEYQLFQELREYVLGFTREIQTAAANLAILDVICSLAECARDRRYQRPHILEDNTLEIIGGRHPVLDANMTSERFVPNDVHLDGDRHRMMIITGPNMAGKSTYIRQTALLVLMAQMGSFIPVDSANIGLVDRIFTRVGAADDLSRGQSTFMVEMVETANILNHATPKSLVILDEIGRGTSTFDGLSIAWAVAEYLHDDEHCRCRTQFATHYHELTELAKTKRGVDNYNVAVKEYGEQIIFLRQIVPGGTDKSYGIHVAKLAGLPRAVVDRANAILESLENSAAKPQQERMPGSHHLAESTVPYQAKRRKKAMENDTPEDSQQLRLF
ncbi:DNA mismatch repair protein MutS [Victivallis sp. Marseille-Q1083]|uniref:DNA mismatch repair protein MutS n=1 Tax=Victivallis sp. Marseille-Q1083 TaxID=2717288 RepID=UPI001C37B570|nr:DNA mismatch repair protein MutS [Victivallis sp. Marseille-Q1083]